MLLLYTSCNALTIHMILVNLLSHSTYNSTLSAKLFSSNCNPYAMPLLTLVLLVVLSPTSHAIEVLLGPNVFGRFTKRCTIILIALAGSSLHSVLICTSLLWNIQPVISTPRLS